MNEAAAHSVHIGAGKADACLHVLELWTASGAAGTVTDTVEALRCLLRTDSEALLLAHINGELVGSLIAGWNGWRGSLYRLAVHPRHRRRGVATQLVREAERRLRARGAVRIDVIIADRDTTAAHFWRAAGYRSHWERARLVRDLSPLDGVSKRAPQRDSK
jgi:ribosomal protein S18 acetylase RimI-like enzyme